MAFKLDNPPYKSTAPVHEIEMEDGVLGKADRNGNILINNKITDPEQRAEVIAHEDFHINEIKMGILDYDDKCVYTRKDPNSKWKCHPRSKMNEGSHALAWEKRAHKHS